ncbi:MAG: hypothetical protein J6U68_00905 [Clostridia bacterium]|nr:hypothetical protein [Clostridia bacterium]
MKALKQEANGFLGKRGRRVGFIFFGLLLIFASFLPIYAFSYIEYLLITLLEYIARSAPLGVPLFNGLSIGATVLSAVIAVLIAIFFTSFVYSRFFSYAYKSYREGIAGEPKFFSVGKGGYFKTWRTGLLLYGILVLCLVPVIVLVEVGSYFLQSQDKRVASLVSYLFVFVIAIGLVLGFLIFLLFRPLFLYGYYVSRGKGVKESVLLSVRRMRTLRAKQMYKNYIRSFLPSLLLSVVTIMVLFIIDTLPKMMAVYYMVADDIVYGE